MEEKIVYVKMVVSIAFFFVFFFAFYDIKRYGQQIFTKNK